MRLAVMQPYLFPYIGYFQLMRAVDHFLFFDDVDFITGGWINRNRILVHGNPHYFTVPLKGASQNRKINQIRIDTGQFENWRSKFEKTLWHSYGKSLYFDEINQLVQAVLQSGKKYVSELACLSVEAVIDYLGLNIETSLSSDKPYDQSATGEQKILQLCKMLDARIYINPRDGATIYREEHFEREGIDLKILLPTFKPYPQESPNFVSHLSILDALFHNSREEIRHLLNGYTLIKPSVYEQTN